MCVQLWVVIELPVPAGERYNIIVRDMALYITCAAVLAGVIETHDVCWTRGFRLILYMRAYKDDR